MPLSITLERHRSPPYIKDGYPKNKTALVNSTVDLECPTLSDLGAYTYWLKGLVVNNSIPSDPDKLEVCRIYQEFKWNNGGFGLSAEAMDRDWVFFIWLIGDLVLPLSRCLFIMLTW